MMIPDTGPQPLLTDEQREKIVLVSKILKSIPTDGEVRIVMIVAGPIKGDEAAGFLTSSCNCCKSCRDSLVYMMAAAIEDDGDAASFSSFCSTG